MSSLCSSVVLGSATLFHTDRHSDDIHLLGRRRYHQRDVGTLHSCSLVRLLLSRAKENRFMCLRILSMTCYMTWGSTHHRLAPGSRILHRLALLRSHIEILTSSMVRIAFISGIHLPPRWAGSNRMDWTSSRGRLVTLTSVPHVNVRPSHTRSHGTRTHFWKPLRFLMSAVFCFARHPAKIAALASSSHLRVCTVRCRVLRSVFHKSRLPQLRFLFRLDLGFTYCPSRGLTHE